MMLGVRADGRKELVALTDGYRESSESWADLLRDYRRRGMRAPALAVGDGALGFWKALREVFPNTREQRGWFHKQANVLAALPKSAHPGALSAMKEIYNAEDFDKTQLTIATFARDYDAKYPKAVQKIDDTEVLLEHFRYPAEHWVHLRTTNPIESTFATVRLRTKATKGSGVEGGGDGDGLQVDRGRAGSMVGGQRPASGGVGAGRDCVPQGQAPRTACRHHSGTLAGCAGIPARLTIPSHGIRALASF